MEVHMLVAMEAGVEKIYTRMGKAMEQMDTQILGVWEWIARCHRGVGQVDMDIARRVLIL
jgi:hypothetical protein